MTEPGKAGKVRESGGWSQSQIHFCLRCRLPGIKPVWWRCGIVNWSRLLKPKTGHQIFWCYILTSEFLCSNDLKCLLMLHWRHKLVGCQWCCSERSRQWGCTVLTELTKVSPLVCNLFVIGLGYTHFLFRVAGDYLCHGRIKKLLEATLQTSALTLTSLNRGLSLFRPSPQSGESAITALTMVSWISRKLLLAEVPLALARYQQGLESPITWNFKVNCSPPPTCFFWKQFCCGSIPPGTLLQYPRSIIRIIRPLPSRLAFVPYPFAVKL